jgi:hypothetical protein
MKISLKTLVWVMLFSSYSAQAAPVHPCATQAIQQAKKLLEFHFGNSDDRMNIDDNVTVLNPLKNPVGKDKYSVLEVTGTIYKGTYRMRLIYGKAGNECVLVGQEILEMVNL